MAWRDAGVLVVSAGTAVALGQTFWPASLVIAVAVGQFFLFCNVFRISRRRELIWTGIFVVLAGGTVLAGFPGWPATLAISGCASVVAVLGEMRTPSYHGVGWRKINPHLKNWWEANHAR